MNNKTFRILHVDDEDFDRELTEHYLSRLSDEMEVISFADVDSALEHLEEGNSVDCILSDYQMPEIDGMEFLKLLKERNVELPFIFLTGQGNEKLAARALREGAADYFSKHEGFAQYNRLVNSIQRSVSAYRQRQEKRKIQEELLQFGRILDQSPNEIFILDGETHKIKHFNQRAAENLDYEASKAGELSVSDLVAEAESEDFQEKLDGIIKGEGTTGVFQVHHRRRDGSFYPVEANVQSLEIGGEDLLVVMARDLTQQVSTKEQLRRSERRYKLLFERDSEAIYIYQADTLKIIDANQATSRLYGYGPEELIGMNCKEFSAEQDESEIKTASSEAENQQRATIHWHKKKDGSIFPVEIINHVLDEGEQQLMFAICRDVSEQFTLEAQLRSTAESLQKRLRELSCRSEISALAESYPVRSSEFLSAVPAIIARAMNPGNLAGVTLEIDGRQYNHGEVNEENDWSITADIEGGDTDAGSIIVSYESDSGKQDGEPALREEKAFLETIVQHLNRLFARYENARGRKNEKADTKEKEYIDLHPNTLLSELFRGHASIMLLINARSGRIVDANRKAEEFYGYSLAEFRIMNINEINQLSPLQVELERRRAAAANKSYFVFPHRLATGEIRTVEVYSSPVEIEGDRLLLSIIHDVEERNDLYHEYKKKLRKDSRSAS